MKRVLFYEGKWYFFSNFSSFSVVWRDTQWMTSEHAYQAAKFDDQNITTKVRDALSAHDSKKIARAHSGEVMKNWNEIKLEITEEIIRAKLEQHPYIRQKLLETGNAEIVEDSHSDSFWGRGEDWRGRNHLGKIWMKLRSELSC